MGEKIVAKLRGLLVNHVDEAMRPEDISVTTSLYEDGLCLDSVELIDFIAEVEKEFSVQFSDEELCPDTFKDIQTLSHILARKAAIDIAGESAD